MCKIIAAINMSLDGFCDHTKMSPDKEIHDHYTQLINNAGSILYGRITFELMEFWKPFIEKPSGEKDMDDFALAIDKIRKIVFSRTLTGTDWKTAELSSQTPAKVATDLKQQNGKDVLVGSRSLIVNLANINMIDEYQICIHPVIVGTGLPLFDQIKSRTELNLLKTKTFGSGAIILYYQQATKQNIGS